MHVSKPFLALFLGLALTVPGWAQEFKIYTQHPRLFLSAQRLRLLQRERDRKSMRWEQFDLLISGQARMPEQGFALALYYRVSGDTQAGLRAVQWALGPASDLRQLALVFDWCQPLLNEQQSRALVLKLQQGLQQAPRAKTVAEIRSRVLAAVALADHLPNTPELTLQSVVQQWWNSQVIPALKRGNNALSRDDLYALLEILHALRDNLELDLREPLPAFFKQLPFYLLISYYPASYPAGENEYRIPAGKLGEPDLRRAALSRATELAMLAYDPNALESQYLQGWLMHDRFLLRGPFGIPYEFLWANPYHPGLSYYQLPLIFHDELFGRLFLRSSWDDDAVWLGYFDGQLQVFEKGEPKAIPLRTALGPIQIGDTVVIPASNPLRFSPATEVNRVFLIGLPPLRAYDVEVDDEEMREENTDRGGILKLDFPGGLRGGLRMKQSAAPQ
jgi:hypothetical protein